MPEALESARLLCHQPIMKHAAIPFLGGLTADQFLSEYWQKKPLLVRNALPGFTGLLPRDEMLDLTGRDDVESRFVSQAGGWTIEHGPFTRQRLRRAAKPWTALVQGLNLVLPAGEEMMRRFSFIPYARLDDLMVSYATDGGGVGPHFDSYDVFLLQGMGKRRWRIGNQKDQTLIDGLPIRILKDFRPVHDWVLESGDLLYLPPEWAHDGIAVGECMTYSVGFRAAPAQELAEQFLTFLQDHIEIDDRYRDPDLRCQKHPAEIGDDMIDQVESILANIRWDSKAVRDFLGCYLTEPKSHIYFDPPDAPLDRKRFVASQRKRGVRLDPRSQLLFSRGHFYINGEAVAVPRDDQPALRTLADLRQIVTPSLSEGGEKLLYDWYRCGFLHLL
jgi:50S ribosomal protein L16 3-hydroxylase